jgi:hypothetical protein
VHFLALGRALASEMSDVEYAVSVRQGRINSTISYNYRQEKAQSKRKKVGSWQENPNNCIIMELRDK